MLDWLLATLVKTFSALLCALPPSVAVWLGERLGLVAMWAQPRRAHVGVTNLRAAFDGQLSPREAHRIIRACFKQLGAGIVEMLRLPAMDRAYLDRYITVEGLHRFEEAHAAGQPAIFLTGHFGNWELSSIAAALKGYPIMALARAQDKFPRLYKLLVSFRESKGCTIAHKGGAMKRLIAALGQGQVVGIVGDQAGRQGLAVNFFGRPALFATGPFDLAYSKGAAIFPAFIYRVRGPYHHVVVEPPLALSQKRPKSDAVRDGMEQFVAALSRHITKDPGQWLWMHKRWKHTTARRALVLSDGKIGHLKQSLAVIEAAREAHPALTHEVVEIRYRNRAARGLALLWAWWMPARAGAATCLQWTLEPACAQRLLTRYADLIVSCGASAIPANLLWASDNRAKSVVIMNPTPIPLNRFDLVIAPKHDALPRRSNVLPIMGAISRMREDDLRQARGRLHAHPNFRAESGAARSDRPTVAVFVGGDTAHYTISPVFAERLVEQVIAACEQADAQCLVTTSRRTAPEVERLLSERLGRHPCCRFLLIASRDPIDLPAAPSDGAAGAACLPSPHGDRQAQAGGTMEGMLGWADVAVVTGESISMVSEACASGRRVVVVEPPLRETTRTAPTKHQRFLRELAKEGYLQIHPLPELGRAIQRAVSDRRPAKRLESLELVRDAVGRLL